METEDNTRTNELHRLFVTQVLVATAAHASVDNVNVFPADVEETVGTALSRATAALMALGHGQLESARATLDAFEVRKRVR